MPSDTKMQYMKVLFKLDIEVMLFQEEYLERFETKEKYISFFILLLFLENFLNDNS